MEPSGHVQACNGIALPLPSHNYTVCKIHLLTAINYKLSRLYIFRIVPYPDTLT